MAVGGVWFGGVMAMVFKAAIDAWADRRITGSV